MGKRPASSRHVLETSIQPAFSLPIGGGKKFHHPGEPGGTRGRSIGLPEELQLGHHQRGPGGQATAQGLLRAQAGPCPPRDHVCTGVGGLGLIWNKPVGVSYEEGSSAHSGVALTFWPLHLPLGQKVPYTVSCSAHMYNSAEHQTVEVSISQRSSMGHSPFRQPRCLLVSSRTVVGKLWSLGPTWPTAYFCK